MKEERMQILRMLEEGKIKADEAFQLINTLDETKPAPVATRKKFLRVRIIDGGETKVNVNIPLQLARVAMRFIPKSALKDHPELNIDELIQDVENGAEGKLVEVQDGGTHVEVYVE